ALRQMGSRASRQRTTTDYSVSMNWVRCRHAMRVRLRTCSPTERASAAQEAMDRPGAQPIGGCCGSRPGEWGWRRSCGGGGWGVGEGRWGKTGGEAGGGWGVLEPGSDLGAGAASARPWRAAPPRLHGVAIRTYLAQMASDRDNIAAAVAEGRRRWAREHS